jgi:parallel beta-helix repeat protein
MKMCKSFILIVSLMIAVNICSAEVYTCQNCSDCEEKISLANPGDVVELSNNITNSNDYCISVFGAQDIIIDCQGKWITKNSSLGYQHNGINIQYSNNITIKNCNLRFYKFSSSDSSYISYLDNNVEESLGDGFTLVWVNSSRLQGNNVTDCYGTGIDLVGSGNNLTKNTIIWAGFQGIDVMGDYNKIRYNVVEHSSIGLWLACSTGGIAANNTFFDDYNGISLSGCFIDQAMQPSRDNMIINNSILSSRDAGIYWGDVVNSTLSGNIVRDNMGDGVRLSGSAQVLNGSLITYYSIDNTFQDNTIEKNSGNGFYFDEHCQNNTIGYNNIRENHMSGVVYNSALNNQVKGNNIINNSQEGIEIISSDNVTVYENTACNNTMDIAISGSSLSQGWNNTCSKTMYWNDTGLRGCKYMCEGTVSSTTTTSSSTTTIMNGQCTIIGDEPPCGEIIISEVVNAINNWVIGQMTLQEVITLINGWALSG